MFQDIKELLDEAAARINVPSFVADDPVQFVHRFDSLQDIEIVALLVSHIAWGRREMILRDAERLMAMMDGQPHAWLTERAYNEVPDALNIHRTFFGRDLKYMCNGLAMIYARHESLEAFVRQHDIVCHEQAAWQLARLLNDVMSEANSERARAYGLTPIMPASRYCLPHDCDKTALKRLNMALRWLVRNDGIVDLGVWTALNPSQLYIPLDVHVGNTARGLGLLSRKQNDKRAVVQLTEELRQMRPDDPTYYDFALFGLGVEE